MNLSRPPKPSPAFVLALAGLAAIAAVTLVARWLGTGGDDRAAEDLLPPGRWHLSPTPDSLGSADEHRRARLMSSPYLAGSRPAEARTGVVAIDEERVAPGWNLYVSGHASEAYLMSNTGEVAFRWRLPLAEAFPGAPPSLDYWRRVQLLPGGDLVALVQGIGLLRLDAASRPVWTLEAPAFNDFFVDAEGRVLTLTKRPTVRAEVHADNEILEDSVTLLAGDGSILSSISLLTALARSPFADLLRPIADAGDVFHSNTVTPLPEAVGTFPAGSVLVSIREIDLVGVVDLDAATFLWARRGPWSRQHEPVLVDATTVLVFDNRGGENGGSRVLELDLGSGEVGWQLGGFLSHEAGSVQRLANGNTLVTESERGRAVELDRDGEVVWEFLSPHRAGHDNELVATLFEVVRLPPDCCPFASAPAQ